MTSTPVQLGAPAETRPALLADRRFWIFVSLAVVYIIWSTTYLGIRYALEGFTPYWLMGIRFVLAGGGLFVFLRLRGAPVPTRRQWGSAAVVGALLLGGGMGSVALAEQTISSGLVAAIVATAPLFTMLFGLLWGRFPTRGEWIGVLLGVFGVALLSLEGDIQGNAAALLLLTFAPAAWGLGSALMPRIDMPPGVMGSAAEMLTGGLILCGMALVRGEPFPTNPNTTSVLALLYLITFGSLATMTAYFYLLKTVSSALATSYAFVNPALALFLGVALAGETITGTAYVALPVILIGVAVVLRARRGVSTPAASPPETSPSPAQIGKQ